MAPPPPMFINQPQYPPETNFNLAMMLAPVPTFPIQSFVHPHNIMPIDPQAIPPPMPNTALNLPFHGKLDGKSISASALEQLQLPQDKITETGIIPNNPYYELPAGLMVPLVPASRVEYKAIDPKELRLPFPKFPDENFLRMIDSFYSRDSDKRDSDGWDKNFVEMYTKQKEALAKMQSEVS
jgi:calcium homeostasis ER protein